MYAATNFDNARKNCASFKYFKALCQMYMYSVYCFIECIHRNKNQSYQSPAELPRFPALCRCRTGTLGVCASTSGSPPRKQAMHR